MAKRILNRKDLRADFDAAERRGKEGKEEEELEEEEETDEEDEGEEDEEGEASDDEAGAEDAEGDDEDVDEDDEDGPKKKKKKAKVAKVVKPKAKPRTRTAKIVRMRVVWGVFSNSNQCVATYEYPRRSEADQHAARLTADKPNNPHFVQPVKEAIEEKKEKEK